MNIQLETRPLAEVDSDALVILAFDAEPPAEPCGELVQEVYSSGEFTGKALDTLVLHRPSGLKAKRLVLAGAGKRAKFDSTELRKLAGAVVRSLKGKGVRSIVLSLGDAFRSDEFASAAFEGALLADLEADRYKTESKKKDKQLDSSAIAGATQSALEHGRIIAESQNFTRELANEPANILTPTVLADRARAMAAQQGLECEILDQDRMRQLGMGALLGVSQGSAEPPALIIVRYKPAAAPATSDHLGLIGKGVTFDTGGVSIKPAEGMEKMRFDMAGGKGGAGAPRGPPPN